MGRSINVTNAGVYIEINQTEKEVSDYFEKQDTDICEWIESEEGELYHQGEMPQNILFVSDGKYDLSTNIKPSEITALYEKFVNEYKELLHKLMKMFDNRVSVKIGVIEYRDEIA